MEKSFAMFRLLLVCFILLSRVLSLRAQVDAPRFNISGTVVNAASGEPVRGALVELISAEKKTALTGQDGHFEIDAVPAGYIDISARRPGFDQQHQRAQHIKVDGNTGSITLKLAPLVKISGRILDREGEPIEGVNVQCLFEQILQGRKQWQPRGGANSDESGHFVIEDLNPGSYLVATTEKQLYFTSPKSEASRYVYPPTYYPEAPTRDLAQRIDLAPGQEMKVDMTLHSIRGVRVSLTTLPPSANIIATIGEENQLMGSNQGFSTQKSGLITFNGVAPGNWKITVRGPFSQGRNPNQEPMYGELAVEVGTTDIENLKVPLGNVSEIPVIVTGAPGSQVFVQLLSKSGMTVGGAVADQNGELKIRSVAPGTYRVLASSNNTCVTSMMSGSIDLLRDELVVAVGSTVPPIQIIQSNVCASISAKGNASVLITSERKGFMPLLMISSGSITAGGLNEGDYKVYAFDDTTDLEYANPDALREFKGQSVHLDAGQIVWVQLELNERRAR